MSWDGKTERRKSPKGLTAFEEIQILHNHFLSLSDRITQHKKSQDEGFLKVGEAFHRIEKSIERVADMLVPSDGSPGIIQDIRDLKKERDNQIEQHRNVMRIAYGAITALIISIAAWLGKAILFLVKLMGG